MCPTLFDHHIGSQTIELIAVVSEIDDMCLSLQMRARRKHIKSCSCYHHIASESMKAFLANEVLDRETKRHQIGTIGLSPNIKRHIATKATQTAAKRELRGVARSTHRHIALQGHAIGQRNMARKLGIEFHEQRIELIGVELQTHIGTQLLGRIDMIELPRSLQGKMGRHAERQPAQRNMAQIAHGIDSETQRLWRNSPPHMLGDVGCKRLQIALADGTLPLQHHASRLLRRKGIERKRELRLQLRGT